MNATPFQMIDRIAPDAPVIQILAVCQGLDSSRTKSAAAVIEEIRRLMIIAQRGCGVTPCEILAELVNDTLLSDDSDPCHIYAPEFICSCNKAMTGQCGSAEK